jgi:hypothetical protein
MVLGYDGCNGSFYASENTYSRHFYRDLLYINAFDFHLGELLPMAPKSSNVFSCDGI